MKELITTLQTITKQKIPKIDYEQQIDVWNKYMGVLDQIEDVANAVSGVKKKREKETNTTSSSSYLLITASFFTPQQLVSLAKNITRSETKTHLVITAKPVLHIDAELYAAKSVKNFPIKNVDPSVILPSLTIKLEKEWLAHRSEVWLMEQMKDIKLTGIE